MSELAASPKMAEPLQEILEAELARGNTVVEVSSWPPKCRLLVLLKRPFHDRYAAAGRVVYAHINDPHYWKAEYRFNDGEEVLACGFK